MASDEENLKPDPQALLDEMKKEAGQKGHIKIFLGYAPGVGKTYSMLEQARAAKKRGIDAVIGVVETHKRSETEALIEGFEIIPRREIDYKGVKLTELDVDSIIKRRPQLVLIDELAHTNAEGSVRLKRYQDVLEIIENNIDVYTTVNIQHFESVHDIVESVTGVKVKEKVPDQVLDNADEIEVVDVPIEELHQRLKEGKVYMPDQAASAIDQFFKRSNLLALREITLRRVATKLDDELVTYMKARAIAGPWPTTDRIMVCVAPTPFANVLVRKAYQLAEDLKAEWYAVYVESIAQMTLDSGQRAKLAETLELAEELGAKVLSLSGSDIAEEILRFASQEKMTKIVMGKPVEKGMFGFFAPSPVTRIIRARREIDIYLVEPKTEEKQETTIQPKPGLNFKPREFILSAFMLLPIIALGFGLKALKINNFSTIFIVPVAISAMLYGIWPSIFVSILSVLCYDFFFVPPVFTFTIADPEYIVELLIFFATSIAVGEMARLFRQQREAIRIRLENVRLLEQMGRDLLNMPAIEQIMDSATEMMQPDLLESIQLINTDILEQVSEITSSYLGKAIKAANSVLFKDRDANLKVWARSDTEEKISTNDFAVANWVYKNHELAGKGTKTLVSSEHVFVPMTTKNGVVGVIAIKADYEMMLPQEKYFLTAIANFAAIAAEKCTKIINQGK